MYKVDRIAGLKFEKGVRMYLVKWEGYDAKHDSWEPMENLVSRFESTTRVASKRRKAAALAKREATKQQAEAQPCSEGARR